MRPAPPRAPSRLPSLPSVLRCALTAASRRCRSVLRALRVRVALLAIHAQPLVLSESLRAAGAASSVETRASLVPSYYQLLVYHSIYVL